MNSFNISDVEMLGESVKPFNHSYNISNHFPYDNHSEMIESQEVVRPFLHIGIMFIVVTLAIAATIRVNFTSLGVVSMSYPDKDLENEV